MPTLRSNFTHLQEHDEQLLRLGMLAERYFTDDPNTCLLKLRQLAETLAQMLASSVGIVLRAEEGQYHLLHRLRDQGILPYEIYQLFTQVRLIGNDANHALKGTHRGALSALRYAWQIGVWFHRAFKDAKFKSGPPQAEQTEIVRRVEALFALADRIEARLATAQRLVERLTPATLSKAFRGDLVPPDPNDESASVLLERLHSDRDRSISPKRKRTPLR